MYKEDLLKAAIEIAKCRVGSASPINASTVIEDSYDKLIEIAERDGILTE